LALDSGMSYRMLILPPGDRDMRPALLRQLRQFVADGLTVVGAPPEISPSLENYPKCDREVKHLAAKLWGRCDGHHITRHPYGRGNVVWGQPLDGVCAELGLQPDFAYSPSNGAKLAFIHRRDGDTDIYFVSNQRKRGETIACSFRVLGKMPELWNPETGEIMPAPVWREENGRTVVSLALDTAGSVFVLFREKSAADHLVALQTDLSAPAPIASPPSDLRILHASYGAFAKGLMDVSDQVKSALGDGPADITANNDLAGEDPAENVVKHMCVVYLTGDERHTNVVAEDKTVSLPAHAQVVSAVYGNFTGDDIPTDHFVDVTDKLESMIKVGRLEAKIDNQLADSDPAVMTPKELHLDYSLRGVTKHLVVDENETLILPQDTPVESGLGYKLSGGRLVSWESGKFDFTWISGRKSSWNCSAPASLALVGPWDLTFPAAWVSNSSVILPQLESWTADSDPAVKYFSGTAAYRKEIEIPGEWLTTNREIWLDLGVVKNLAEVFLNGQSLGIIWKPPFRANLSAAAHPGTNTLEVKVTNLWPNRLIGDEQLPADREWSGSKLKAWPQWLLDGKQSPTGRLTFTTWHHWKKDDAVLESGLLGPVTLQSAEVLNLP